MPQQLAIPDGWEVVNPTIPEGWEEVPVAQQQPLQQPIQQPLAPISFTEPWMPAAGAQTAAPIAVPPGMLQPTPAEAERDMNARGDALKKAMLSTANTLPRKKYGTRSPEEYSKYAEEVAKRAGLPSTTPEFTAAIKTTVDAFDLSHDDEWWSKTPKELRPSVLEAIHYWTKAEDKRAQPGWLERTTRMANAGLAKAGQAVLGLNPFKDKEQWDFEKAGFDIATAPERFVNPDQGFLSQQVQSAVAVTPKIFASGTNPALIATMFGLPAGVQASEYAQQHGASPATAAAAGLEVAALNTLIFGKLPGSIIGKLGGEVAAKEAIGSALDVAKRYVIDSTKTAGVMTAAEYSQKVIQELAIRADVGQSDKSDLDIITEAVKSLPEVALQAGLLHAPGAIAEGLQVKQQRLADLDAIGAKGYVAATDGIEGETRAKRMENLTREKQQIQKEIQDAGTPRGNAGEVRQDENAPASQGQGEKQVQPEPEAKAPAEDEVLKPPKAEPTTEELSGIAAKLKKLAGDEEPAPTAPAAETDVPPISELGQKRAAAEAESQIDESRVAELFAKRFKKSGSPKIDARREESIRAEVAEEAEALHKYPPGTKLEIKGYRDPFDVKPDGTLVETSTGRTMGDNAGSVLRKYTPDEITVISSPEAPTETQAAPPELGGSAPAVVPATAVEPAPKPKLRGRKTEQPGEQNAQIARSQAAATYDDIQRQIDDYEDGLTKQGIDPVKLKTLPPKLADLYRQRDEAGTKDLSKNIDDLSKRLRSAGLSEDDVKPALKVFAIDGTDAVSQYTAAEFTQKLSKQSFDELIPKMYFALAEARGKDISDIQSIGDIRKHGDQQTLKDAMSAVFAVGEYFGREVPTPKSSGQKEMPPEPSLSPELSKAGITIKKTPKGWSMTGIPEEIADGLSIDYQGKRAGKGHVFQLDPTEGLRDAAPAIKEEAEQAAAAEASGLVRTRIGTLTPESAQHYEQERADRLKDARQQIKDRNESVDTLLGNFVPKSERAAFKLELRRARDKSDISTVKRFDEMVQFSNDHPDLNLPKDEAGLADLLTNESFKQNDKSLLDKIDDDLAAEIEAQGDASFDFGKNVEPEKLKRPVAAAEVAKPEPGSSDETTGTKNVKTDEIRAKAGMKERPPVEPESVEQWQSEAAKKMAANPQYAGKLVAELADNPRSVDPVEEAVLGRHLRDLENRRKAGEDVFHEMRTAVEADERVGTEWGRTGVSRQTELAADFSVEGLTRQYFKSVHKLPSDEEMAKYAEHADKIAKLEGELKEEQQKRAQAEIDKQVAEAKLEKPKPAAVPKKTGRRQTAEKRVSDAWAAFNKAATGRVGSGVPLDLLPHALEIAKAYAGLGVVRFSEFMENVRKNSDDPDEELFREAWKQASPKVESTDSSAVGALARKLTRAVVESGITEREAVIDAVHEELTGMGVKVSRSDTMAAMSGYGDFRELSKDEVSVKVRGIKGEIQQLLKLEDMQAGQAPKKTGVERRDPTDEERRLIKDVNEAKKKGGYTVTDPARQLESALSAAKTAARNRITDLETAIADGEKIVSGQTTLKPDAELTALRKHRDELNAEYKEIFPPKKTGFSDAQRLKMAEKLLDRHISDLQADIDAGRLGPQEKKAWLTSPALEAKKQQLESLKEVREQARAASPEYQAQEAVKQNERYKKALDQQLAFWENRRDEAALGKLPEKRKPTPVDNAILEKKYQIEQVKRHARAEIEEAERKARSRFGKALGFGGDLLDLSIAIRTGYELSAVLRQGAIYTLGFPKEAFPAVWNSIRAAFSRRADFALHDDLMARPDHADMVRGGMETTASDGPLSHREELIRSRLASWLAKQEGSAWALPRWAAEVLLGGERAFRSFGNTMRADLFSYMKGSVESSRPGTWSGDDAKVIGSASNVVSGRGELPQKLSGLGGVGGARFFWAPRWVWSRGQLLVGQPLWKGDSATRMAVGKVYVRGALGYGSYMLIKHAIYSLLAGDDEHKPKYEIDPRASDFGKTRLGESRLDSGAGANQLITLAARQLTGTTKLSSGKIVPIRGDDVPYGADDSADILTRFLRSKLAPLPSAVLDFMSGKNVVGQKTTVAKTAGESVTPMTWNDIWQAEKELNVPQGTVAALEAFFGMGLSTYGHRTTYMNGTPEQREEQVTKDLKNMQWDSPEKPAYAEFLTEEQLNKFSRRLTEKRRQVREEAKRKPERKNFKSQESFDKAIETRNKNREYLQEMNVSE